MRENLYDFCNRTGQSILLEQWNVEQNLPLTPQDISYGSKKKVWWKCGKEHCWQAAVYTRTGAGAGCPVCAGKSVRAGENDLASLYPELAKQWDWGKNWPLRPEQVLPGSHRAVWWICESGHEWRTQIKLRTSGCDCPVCANRVVITEKNDLRTRFADIAAEWHPSKNGALTPQQVSAGAQRKVWWQCSKGHEWKASVYSRTNDQSGCPICAGKQVLPGFNDLETVAPLLAAEWDTEKNGALTPRTVLAVSKRKVWWRCALGHEYVAVVSMRIRDGTGCPYCAGKKVLPGFNDLATVEPLVAAQWHKEWNGALTPQIVTAGSHRKVWWQCAEGHVWQAAVYSRTGTRKCGCPICAGRGNRARQQRYQALLMQERNPQR